jgi:hypothetical protein
LVTRRAATSTVTDGADAGLTVRHETSEGLAGDLNGARRTIGHPLKITTFVTRKSVKVGLGMTALIAIAIPTGALVRSGRGVHGRSNGGSCPGRLFIKNVQNLADHGTVVGFNGTA